MIDLRDEDILHDRRTSDGRFVLFLRGDFGPDAILPWWGVVFDIRGDGHAVLVRLDETTAPEGWTALNLLDVVLARASAEFCRRPTPTAHAQLQHLRRASDEEGGRRGQPAEPPRLRLLPGFGPSPYPWTTAQLTLDGPELPLCPDPAGRESGITPEQLLLVLVQLFADAATARPDEQGRLGACLRDIRIALELERRR